MLRNAVRGRPGQATIEDNKPSVFVHNLPPDVGVLPEVVVEPPDPPELSYEEKWGLPESNKALFNLDGPWATASSCDGIIFVWPLDHESSTPPCVRCMHGHRDVVTDYVMDWDRMVSISAGLDCCISVCDLENICHIGHIKNDTGLNIEDAFFSIDGDLSVGKVCVGDGRGKIKVADLEMQKILFRMHGHTQSVYGVWADWDQNLVASCSWDKKVNLYDLRAGKLARSLKGHQNCVSRLEVNFEMQLAVSCAWESQLILWDLKSGELITSYPSHRANDVSVDWQRFVAATCGDDDTVRIWDLESGECTRTIECHYKSGHAIDVDWERGLAMTGSVDKVVKLFDIVTGEEVKQFNKARRVITQCWLQKAKGH